MTIESNLNFLSLEELHIMKPSPKRKRLYFTKFEWRISLKRKKRSFHCTNKSKAIVIQKYQKWCDENHLDNDIDNLSLHLLSV